MKSFIAILVLFVFSFNSVVSFASDDLAKTTKVSKMNSNVDVTTIGVIGDALEINVLAEAIAMNLNKTILIVTPEYSSLEDGKSFKTELSMEVLNFTINYEYDEIFLEPELSLDLIRIRNYSKINDPHYSNKINTLSLFKDKSTSTIRNL